MAADVVAPDHEQVVYRSDAGTGLRAIIAIHNTKLGPAAGGCRRWVYPDTDSALQDALRLSRGMTFKNAVAGLPFGGGKSVILAERGVATSPEQLELFGQWVEELGGRYITAEDVGMCVSDLRVVAQRTRYVSGLGNKSGVGGDPSPKTALGVLRGIEVAVRHGLGRNTLTGLSIAVQGLGNVGFALAGMLHRAGAELVVADIDPGRVACAVQQFGARVVPVAGVASQPVDVYAPCALGAVLTPASVAAMQASVIAGAANNQLSDNGVDALLRERGILYAPDYVINAGGVISVAHEYLGGDDPCWVTRHIDRIGGRLAEIFELADRRACGTQAVADKLAHEILDRPALSSEPPEALQLAQTS